ncbi:MAG: NAD(P)-dependent glycerol-3-phosphate dehydrogenase [Acidobacteriota bacterium]|nr:NAD(P)-dependent glycerol-3-phosphate dehydrogenase [Acidobacteriota bacterium]
MTAPASSLIFGAGSWGTALAVHLATAGHRVQLWGRDADLIEGMQRRRVNETYLPAIPLPDLIEPTTSFDAVRSARFVIFAVPSHGFRAVARAAAPHLSPEAIAISATKGLEELSLCRMTEVLGEELPRHPVVALSGPSFALELARQQPTAIVAASANSDAVAAVQEEFRGRSLRLYGSDDVIGVEMGGALKNVIAIAAGIVEGTGLGHNALAGLITRGLAEISRLSVAAGGRRDTLSGLSGLGDLVLTCTGALSRNRHVGVELGRGQTLEQVLGSMKMVAEGVRTTRAALALGERYGVELPIARQMSDVMAGTRTAEEALQELMIRRQRHENDR